MKAPDKICLVPYLDNPDKLHPSWYHYDIIGGGIEYIRKDALLEWAKELRENARASRENPPSIEFDRYMEGKEKTISKFIDKLNSL